MLLNAAGGGPDRRRAARYGDGVRTPACPPILPARGRRRRPRGRWPCGTTRLRGTISTKSVLPAPPGQRQRGVPCPRRPLHAGQAAPRVEGSRARHEAWVLRRARGAKASQAEQKKAAADRRRSHGLTGAGLDPAHGHPAARGALHGRARRQGARARARRERGGGGGGVRGRHAGRWCSRSTGARPRSSSRNFVVLRSVKLLCAAAGGMREPPEIKQ